MSQDSATSESEAVGGLLQNSDLYVKSTSNSFYPNSMAKQYLEHDPDVINVVKNLKKVIAILTGVVIVVVICLSVVIAVLFTRLNNELTDHKHVPSVQSEINTLLAQEGLCFKCRDIQTGPSFEEHKSLKTFRLKKAHDGEELCCVDTARQLLKKLEMYVEKIFWKEVSQGSVKLPGFSTNLMTVQRPAALLIGPEVQSDHKGSHGKQFAISGWETKQDIAFLRNVSYRHGRLVVHSAGYYYVYSQVSFLEITSSSTFRSQSLSHYIYRYNSNYDGEERLLQNAQTKCWSKSKSFGEYSSYIGAVLFLRGGDEVYVKVSNISILAKEKKTIYFGLYQL